MTNDRKPTKEDLRTRLSSLQYHVTQEKGTERAFTGRYAAHTAPGTYYCVCCGADLFESEKKFDAGCGWPSFWLLLAGTASAPHLSHGQATEVTCSRGAHLAMCSTMAPSPRACATASTPLRWVPRGVSPPLSGDPDGRQAIAARGGGPGYPTSGL
jgi:peptide-methionine (R)-S-oxide reductase